MLGKWQAIFSYVIYSLYKMLGNSVANSNIVYRFKNVSLSLSAWQRTYLNFLCIPAATKISRNQERVAEQLAVSAIVVQDLKDRRVRDYKFDWEKLLSRKGDTGVHLQYAHARLCR